MRKSLMQQMIEAGHNPEAVGSVVQGVQQAYETAQREVVQPSQTAQHKKDWAKFKELEARLFPRGVDGLKLFVWEEVFTDYTDGIAFALAGTADEARELIVQFSAKPLRESLSKGTQFRPALEECEIEVALLHDRKSILEELTGEPSVYASAVGFSLSGGS